MVAFRHIVCKLRRGHRQTILDLYVRRFDTCDDSCKQIRRLGVRSRIASGRRYCYSCSHIVQVIPHRLSPISAPPKNLVVYFFRRVSNNKLFKALVSRGIFFHRTSSCIDKMHSYTGCSISTIGTEKILSSWGTF